MNIGKARIVVAIVSIAMLVGTFGARPVEHARATGCVPISPFILSQMTPPVRAAFDAALAQAGMTICP